MIYDVYFEVVSKLGFKIRTTKHQWDLITLVKHPIIYGLEREVMDCLRHPAEVRLSQESNHVYLYYKRWTKYWLCVVARHMDSEGFIITIYVTDKIKEGSIVWKS
ncbi:MAG: DUF4258 domain-containing protein [Candidatus Schekmanbacteria bacterium]|nr:DUF4258 domain-containing protein [Candidatus Schekmanbacteria bacterium]